MEREESVSRSTPLSNGGWTARCSSRRAASSSHPQTAASYSPPSLALPSSPSLLLLLALLWVPSWLLLPLCRAASAPMSIQPAEKAALLALKANLTAPDSVWVGSSWDQFGPTTPCGGTRPWKYINCTNSARVSSIDFRTARKLQGRFPWGALSPLKSLRFLRVPNQLLEGPVFPDDMPLLTGLTFLDMGYNKLQPLTSQVSQLPNLKYLDLSGNELLSGPLDSLTHLTGLLSLSLRYTAFHAPLPSSLASLTSLIALDLQGSQLIGSLPDSFSLLTNLQYFNVPKNQFSGSIPSSWAALNQSLSLFSVATNQLSGLYPTVVDSFANLAKLDLSQNKFLGPVPAQLWSSNISDLDISGNYFNGSVPANRTFNMIGSNCFDSVSGNVSETGQRNSSDCSSFYASYYAVPVTTSTSTQSSSPNIGLIVGVSVAVAAIVIASALLVFFYCQRRNRLAKRLRKGTMQSTREFTYNELKAATKNWNTVLGRGGYGSVYKAELRDGSAVAVKRLDQVSDQGDQEFIREVELLSRVHHRHLVNLLGFCGERGERALIYEYMGLGSLYDHLHGECAKEQPLSWDSRIKIAIHVAFGIDYLHYGADPPLIHRDIKSGNILLSDDGYAKVADFGLCKEAPVGVTTDGTAQLVPEATEVRGSFGYLDPEYVNTSVLSEKSDVYSYGVVLLELITGKKSIHDWQPLAYWAEPYLEDPNKLAQLVDPALGDEYDAHELQILCDIARSCTYDQAAMRPAIRDVAQALVENLGRVVTSTASDSDPSGFSSEFASSSDPTDTCGVSGTFTAESEEYSFRNAASEALLVGLTPKDGEEEKGPRRYVMATGPDGSKLPVPVGKHEDTV